MSLCLPEEVIQKAVEDKEKYNTDKKELGLERLQAVISPDEKFGRILSWIRDEGICLRRGEEPENACYALSDFGLDKDPDAVKPSALWFLTPYTKSKELTNKW